MGEGRTIRVLHAADLHLDSPFSGLSGDAARRRRQESRAIPEKLLSVALREKVELVLLAGDVFDGSRVYPETVEALADALGSMPCPVCISPGNHDPYWEGSPYCTVKWPANVHIFRSAQPEAFRLKEKSCTVYGAAFTELRRSASVLDGFSADDDGGIAIGCFHGDVGAGDSIYGPIGYEEIRRSGLHYLALGHIHERRGPLREGGTYWAYSGCTEGRGFDETGEKGVLLLNLSRDSAEARFLPLEGRQYRILHVDVTGKDVLTAAAAALTSVPDGDPCRLVLTGETDETVDAERVERILMGERFSLSVRDRTRPTERLWEAITEGSLRGLFLEDLKKQYDMAQTEQERDRILAAARYGLAALNGRDVQ